MRWREGRRSENVEDERGAAASRGGGGCGSAAALILLLLGAWLFGADPLTLLSILADGGGGSSIEVPDTMEDGAPAPAANDEGAHFVSVVLADTEDTWTEIFQSGGERYQPPKLVLFTDVVRSACGMAQSAMGPFYCPERSEGLHRPRLLSRAARTLPGARRFRAGLRDRARDRAPRADAARHVAAGAPGAAARAGSGNALSVRLELQADCYAGVWAHHATARARSSRRRRRGRAQRRLRDRRRQHPAPDPGHRVPESFTHGSSQQRVAWFRRGLESGSMKSCDTFSGSPQ